MTANRALATWTWWANHARSCEGSTLSCPTGQRSSLRRPISVPARTSLRRAEGGNLPVRLRSIRGSARPHSARQRRDCTPHWPSHCPAFPPDPPASASLTIVRLCLCALGRHSASPTTCQCAARRPQARPKVRPRRRTARAPPKRPRRVSRRASARTLASLLLTHHFRRSTDASNVLRPARRPPRPCSTRSLRDARVGAQLWGGRAADGERGLGARADVCLGLYSRQVTHGVGVYV